jgi:hypothetical protein
MQEQTETLVAIIEEEEVAPRATWAADAPRPVVVEIIINKETGQGDFSLESNPNGNGVPIIQDFIVQFDNNQNGLYSNGFLITFHLPPDRGVNANWTFDADPIWAKLVDKHGACPNNKNANNPNILTDQVLSPDKRYLTVQNANSSQAYFGFTLRFASTTGKTLSYDPIGDNQNGHSAV